MGIEILGQRNFIDIVEVKKLLGRRRRTVWFVEADGEKERFVFVSTQIIDRSRRDLVITMRLAITIKQRKMNLASRFTNCS